MLNFFLQNKINKQINKCYSSQAHFYPFFCYAEKHVDIISKGLFLLDFFFQKLQQNLLKPAGLSSDNSCHELHQSRFHCYPFLAASKNTSTTITDQ